MSVAGRPVLEWTIERLLESGAVSVVVALPRAMRVDALPTTAIPTTDSRVLWTPGGATRQESVRRCLDLASDAGDDGLIVVHDGVRPAVSVADVLATVAAASESGAAVLGRAVHDTLKRVESGKVTGTVDRSSLFRAETPQVFRRELLERAFAAAERDGFTGTDEASLVERLDGVTVRAVEATAPNPKLTRPDDLAFLASLLTA